MQHTQSRCICICNKNPSQNVLIRYFNKVEYFDNVCLNAKCYLFSTNILRQRRLLMAPNKLLTRSFGVVKIIALLLILSWQMSYSLYMPSSFITPMYLFSSDDQARLSGVSEGRSLGLQVLDSLLQALGYRGPGPAGPGAGGG